MAYDGSTPLKNTRRELFCQSLITGMTQSAAAIAAGYKPSRSEVTGAFLVRESKVSARMNYLKRVAEAKATQVLADDVLSRREREIILSEIARGRLVDYIDANGEPVINKDAPNARALTDYARRRSYNKDGAEVISKIIKLNDPIRAIAELNKMSGDYAPEKRINVSAKVKFVIGQGYIEVEDDS